MGDSFDDMFQAAEQTKRAQARRRDGQAAPPSKPPARQTVKDGVKAVKGGAKLAAGNYVGAAKDLLVNKTVVKLVAAKLAIPVAALLAVSLVFVAAVLTPTFQGNNEQDASNRAVFSDGAATEQEYYASQVAAEDTGGLPATLTVALRDKPLQDANGALPADNNSPASSGAEGIPGMAGKIVQIGEHYSGMAYVFADRHITDGAASTGTDCSGYTALIIFLATGKALPMSAAAQGPAALKAGAKKIDSIDDAKPGDLLVSAGHAAIFVAKDGPKVYVLQASSPNPAWNRIGYWEMTNEFVDSKYTAYRFDTSDSIPDMKPPKLVSTAWNKNTAYKPTDFDRKVFKNLSFVNLPAAAWDETWSEKVLTGDAPEQTDSQIADATASSANTPDVVESANLGGSRVLGEGVGSYHIAQSAIDEGLISKEDAESEKTAASFLATIATENGAGKNPWNFTAGWGKLSDKGPAIVNQQLADAAKKTGVSVLMKMPLDGMDEAAAGKIWDKAAAWYNGKTVANDCADGENAGKLGDEKIPESVEAAGKRIWAFLKHRGWSDNDAAGALINFQKENGIDPTAVEGIYNEHNKIGPQKKKASQDWENYTLTSLFPKYASSGVSINKDAYKGSDKKYYPGLGFGSYTGPLASGLLQAAEKTGKPWYSLDLQVAFMFSEPNREKTANDFKNNPAKTPGEAAGRFYDVWEGMRGIRPDWRAPRVAEAPIWLKKIESWGEPSGNGAENIETLIKQLKNTNSTPGNEDTLVLAGGADTIKEGLEVTDGNGKKHTVSVTALNNFKTVIETAKKRGLDGKKLLATVETVWAESKGIMYSSASTMLCGGYTASELASWREITSKLPHDAESKACSAVGLFQQQMWWGGADHHTYEGRVENAKKVMDPVESTNLFVDALNKKWVDGLPADQNAEKVQVSGLPEAYRIAEPAAKQIISAVGAGDSQDVCASGNDDVTGSGKWGVSGKTPTNYVGKYMAELPAELKPYALDPGVLGLKKTECSKWLKAGADPNNLGQCVALTQTMAYYTWSKGGQQLKPARCDGPVCAKNYHAAYGGKPPSTTPTTGAVASSLPYHTFFVSHVFEDGGILIIEQNIPGTSGIGDYYGGCNPCRTCDWSWRVESKESLKALNATFWDPATAGYKHSDKFKEE